MRRRISAMLSAVLAVGGIAIAVPGASAAPATISNLSVMVTSDGTAPFDTLDDGAENGVVRTQDRVTYAVSTTFATTGDITYSATLPAGMEWDASAAAPTVCTAGGSLSADRRTLTCARSAGSLVEQFEIIAWVYAVGNGTAVAPTISAGGVDAAAPDVTVAAEPKTEARFHSYIPSYRHNVTVNGQLGFTYSYGLYLGATATSTPVDFRGYESLASPFTFDLELPPNAVVTSVSAANGTASFSQAGPGATASVSVANASTSFKNPAQSGPWPTYYVIHSTQVNIFVPYDPTLPAGEKTLITTRAVGFDPTGLGGGSNFGAGYAPGYALDYTCPSSAASIIEGLSCYQYTVDRSRAYDVIGATGAVGQSPGGLLLGDGHLAADGWEKVVPGQTFVATAGFANSGSAQSSATTPYNSVVWDNTYLTLAAPAQAVYQDSTAYDVFITGGGRALDPATVTIEYSAQTFSSNDERRQADNGVAGDGAPGWVTDPATLPGGWASVTSVRMSTSTDLPPGRAIGLQTSLMRTTGAESLALPVDAPISWFHQYGTAQTPLVKSAFSGSGPRTAGGAWVQAAPALIRANTTATPGVVEPGDLFTVTVRPTVIGPVGDGITTVSPRTKATVTLDSTCSEPVASSLDATGLDYDYTPGDFGADGIPCTDDDGAPATIVFDLGDVAAEGGAVGGGYATSVGGHATALPVISFAVTTSALTPSGEKTRAQTVMSSDADTSKDSWEGIPNQFNSATDRTDYADVTVRGVATLKGSKSAATDEVGMAAPGEDFGYTIGWGNGSPTTNGPGAFVDVLPFEGDGRGTAGLGSAGLRAISAAAATNNPDVMGDVSIWYTMDDPAAVLAALGEDGNEGGGTGIDWHNAGIDLVDLPAGVTALRFVTSENIASGYGGTATITVEAPTFAIGGTLGNTIYGRTEMIGHDAASSLGFRDAARVDLASSAGSVSGTISRDLDLDGAFSVGDGAWPASPAAVEVSRNGTVIGTADVAADGRFTMPLVAPGTYSVALVDSITGWSKVLGDPVTVAAGQTRTDLDALYREDVADPILRDDAATVRQDRSVAIDVTANDTLAIPLAEGSIFTANTVAIGTAPTTGSVALVPPTEGRVQSTVQYTAATAWPVEHEGESSYIDSFTYTWTNAPGVTEEATVSVTVTAVPAPVVTSGQVTIAVGGSHDFDADPVTERVIASAIPDAAFVDGTVSADVDGTVSYAAGSTPPGVYTVEVVFTDDLGRSAVGTYEITIQAAPAVTGETATTIGEGQTARFPMQVQGVVASASITEQPSAGTVSAMPDGVVTFAAGDAAPGVYTFEVTFSDDLGQTTIITYTVTIQARPVAEGGQATIVEKGAHAFVESVRTDGVIVARELTAPPTAGRTTVETLLYEAEDALGRHSFEVTYTDNLGQTATATYDVTVQAAPTGTGCAVTVDSDTERVTFDPLGDATGTNLRQLTDADLTSPAHGTVRVENGLVVYTPQVGYVGTVTFTVTVTDDLGQRHTLAYAVTIVPPGGPSGPAGVGDVVDGSSDGSGAARSTSALATTGAHVLGAAGIAIATVCGGLVLLFVARRRRHEV